MWGGAELRAEALVGTRGSWGLLRVSTGPHLWGHKWVWGDTGQMLKCGGQLKGAKSRLGGMLWPWSSP